MKVTEILAKATKPLFTFEVVPPLKGANIQSLLQTIRTLSAYQPAYINITNHQSEVVYVDRPDGLVERKVVHKRPGTVALSALIQYTFGIPVVSHIICGGQSAEEIENSLVELNFLGIDNVLALRGDPPAGQKRFVPVPGGWSHSDQLVGQIVDLNHGKYLEETVKEPVATDFCIGVAGYPEKHAEAPNGEDDIANLKRKVEKGAGYVVTQLFYDNARYYAFVDACRTAGITCPIIPGLKPLSSRKDLETIPQTFHVDIPKDLADAVQKAPDLKAIKAVGVEWAIMQTKDLLSHQVPGVHYYTLGKPEAVAGVVEASF
jgi:methylenetetrahydrofolate reductase (NADPH)